MATEVLRIVVDPRDGVRGANEVRRGLDGVSSSAGRAVGAVDKTESAFTRLRRTAFGLYGILAQIGAVITVRQLIQYADTWTMVEGRLRLATRSTEEFLSAQTALFRIAQQTRAAFAPTADLYSRMARNAGELGASMDDLLTVTQAINESMVISGASAQAAEAALTQLVQAFGSGVLRGEELNSVLEQAPRLAEAIATGMGVTVGQLRALGQAGALSAKAVFDALRGQARAINDEFSSMEKTVGQATTVMENSLTRFIGKLDDALGFTAGLSDAIIRASDNIDALTTYVTENAETWGRWGRGIVAVVKTLAAPVRIAFNLGQTIGEFVNALLSGINFMVVETVNLVIKAINHLPGVNVALIDSAKWAEENARAWGAIVDNGRDIIDTIGGVGSAWASVISPMEQAANAAERVNRATGVGGAGGVGAGGVLTGRLPPRLAAGGSLRTVGAISSGRPAWAYEGSILRRAAEEGQAALESEQVWARAMENIQDVFADGFEDIFRDGLAGFKSMADAVGKIFGGLGRQIAAALAIEKLGIDDIIKTIREEGVGGLSTRQKLGGAALAGFGIGYGSGNAGMGFLGGAGAGFALGGPMGALGGAVAGLAGGLLGAAQKTREAQRIFTEAMNNVAQSLEDIRNSAAGINDPMKGLRDSINATFDMLRQGFAARGFNAADKTFRTAQDVQDYIDRLRLVPENLRPSILNEFIRQLENLHATFAESTRLLEGSYRESLQDRLDQLTGNDAAVLARRQQKEREEAILAGFDATTLALLDQVHEQERLAQATKATSDAIRNVTSALNAPSGLRLSLYRWRATAPGLDPELAPFNPSRDTNIPPMTQHNGDVIIQITQQPGESQTALADRIVESLERKQRRGGPAVVNRISSR